MEETLVGFGHLNEQSLTSAPDVMKSLMVCELFALTLLSTNPVM